MNAYEQLEAIQERLELNGASEESIALVAKFLKRAEPERDSSTSVPQVMMLRHLLKQREALDNFAIYNDLQELLTEYDERRAARDEDAVRPAYELDRAPKPKSFYKSQKERERNGR